MNNGQGITKGSRLFLRSGGKVVFVNVEDIDWLEAAANYVKVHTGGEVHSIRATMAAFETQLDPARFIRIHRSTIVNVEQIRELRPCKNGEFIVILRNGKELSLGRNFRAKMQNLIRGSRLGERNFE